MNTRVKERQELESARQVVKNLSNREFEELRIVLGLTRSREELLQRGAAPRPSTKIEKKK